MGLSPHHRRDDDVNAASLNRAGGSRLVRWAAVLAGRNTSPPVTTSSGNKQHRPSSGGIETSTSSANAGGSGSGGGGGLCNSGGGGGGSVAVGGDSYPPVTLAEGGLFASSPLRHRFRSARRGSNSGWSSSSTSSAAGWIGGGAGAGGERGAAPTTLLGKVVKGPLAMYVTRQAKMIAALAALAVAGLGALLVGLCLYLTVRPWGRATYRRLLCSQLAAPLVDSASLLLPRTRVRVTGDSDMLDGLCPCVIVSNTLPGNAFLGLDWWTILQVARAVGAHGYTKVLVRERLNNTPVLGWILKMLEFPGLGDCYQKDRDRIKRSLASFARDSVSAGPSGVPYLFLHFPEGDTLNRQTLATSLEFAQREDRPELRHLLLPHTTALSACLDGLRPSKPVVYDVTLAAEGYSGETPCASSPPSDWNILRALVAGRAWEGGRHKPCMTPSCVCPPRQMSDAATTGGDGGSGGAGDFCGEPAAGVTSLGFNSVGSAAGIGRSESGDLGDGDGGIGAGEAVAAPGMAGGAREGERRWGRGCKDIHVRIKRYSLEEVVGGTRWLDDRWAEKERLLSYFARHQSFPSDGRGFPARRTLDTRGGGQFEGSVTAFIRLSGVLLFVPVFSLVALPLVVTTALAALGYRLTCAAVRAVATRVLPRRLTRKIWCAGRGDDEDEEEDELGQDYGGRQSTLTPWWGGPATPLNTPAPGGAGPVPCIRSNSVSSVR